MHAQTGRTVTLFPLRFLSVGADGCGPSVRGLDGEKEWMAWSLEEFQGRTKVHSSMTQLKWKWCKRSWPFEMVSVSVRSTDKIH